MIFGHSPFEGKNMNSIMINIKTKDLTYDKPISKECKNLIEKMLENNQQKRFKITDIFEHDFIKKYTKKKNDFIITENDLNRYKEIKNIKTRNFEVKKTFTFQNININIENNIINLSKNKTKHIKKYINKRNSDKNFDGLIEKPKKNQKLKNQIFIQNLKSSLISQLEKAKKNIENFTFIKNEKYTFEDFRDDEKMVKTFKNDDKMPKKHKIKSSKILRRDESSLIDTDDDLFICEQNISLSEKDIEENIETFSSSIDSCIDNSIIERLNKAYKKYGKK
jgi:serine/threonine protein kinase